MNVKLQATWNVAFSWLCSRCMMADNTMLTVESIKKEAQSCNMQWSEIANSAVTVVCDPCQSKGDLSGIYFGGCFTDCKRSDGQYDSANI